MTMDRTTLTESVLCGTGLKFRCTDRNIIFGVCNPQFLQGAISFHPQNDINNCNELAMKGRFNSNSMTCSCKKCEKCGFLKCGRNRIFCKCNVELFPFTDLPTADYSNATIWQGTETVNSTTVLNVTNDNTTVIHSDSTAIWHETATAAATTMKRNVTTDYTATKNASLSNSKSQKGSVASTPSVQSQDTVVMTTSNTKTIALGSEKMSTETIIGGAVGSFIAVIFLVIIGAIIWKRKQNKYRGKEFNVIYSEPHSDSQEENQLESRSPLYDIPEDNTINSQTNEKKMSENSNVDSMYSFANNAYFIHEASLGIEEGTSRQPAAETLTTEKDNADVNQTQPKSNITDVIYQNTQPAKIEESDDAGDKEVYNHLHETTRKTNDNDDVGEYSCLGNPETDYGDLSEKGRYRDVDDTYDHNVMS